MIDINQVKAFVQTKISVISAETFGWLAAIVLHSATVPSMLLVWTGLTLLFVKATIQKDMLNIVTIGFGFIVQAVLMALIFFK
jgi:hypothetical protein